MQSPAPQRLLLLTACALALFATIGAAIPYPILPPLFAGTALNDFNHFAGLPPKFLLGVAIAINPLGLFIGSATLGPLSDRYGRRPLLLWTTLVSALGHLATIWTLLHQHYPLFLLARLITGVAEGNVAVARAMLADELDGDARTRAFAWFNSAMYGGWLAGPLLSGLTIGFGIATPFSIAALVLLATLLMGWFSFPGRTTSIIGGSFWRHVRERHALKLLKQAELRELFLLQLAYCCAVFAFYEFYPLWLVEFAHFDTPGISWMTALLCAVMSATSVAVGRGWLRAGDEKSLHRYALLTAFFVALTAVGGMPLSALALVAFGWPNALYNAILPAYCSQRFAHEGQGSVMGLLATTACLANLLIALLGAVLTLIDTRAILLFGAVVAIGSAWRLRTWTQTPSHPALNFAEPQA